MPTPPIYAELRRHDDDSLVGVVTLEQYHSLPTHDAAAMVPHLFTHAEVAGSRYRVELGTLVDLVRALGLGRDFSASRVALSREVRS